MKGSVIHWMNGGGADCGAPAGSNISEYPHVVTCEQCIIAIRIDVLRRRLQSYRAVVALGSLERHKRGGTALPTRTAFRRTPDPKP